MMASLASLRQTCSLVRQSATLTRGTPLEGPTYMIVEISDLDVEVREHCTIWQGSFLLSLASSL